VLRSTVEHFERIAGELAKFSDPIVLVDPFVSFFEGDENKTEVAVQWKWALERLQRDVHGMLLVLLHHLSKAGAKNDTGGKVYGSRGSTVLPGWTDAQYEIRDFTNMAGAVRFVVEPTKMRGIGTPPPHTVLSRFGEGISWSPESDAEWADRKAQVLAFVRSSAEPVSKRDIQKAVSGRREGIYRAVDELIREGLLKSGPRGLELATTDPEWSPPKGVGTTSVGGPGTTGDHGDHLGFRGKPKNDLASQRAGTTGTTQHWSEPKETGGDG
jgi:hypothetical protein